MKVLRELGALGSVTAVAEALNVSPSAVSQHLATLQRGFATPLTRKQGRTLVLTDAGRVLADAGVSVLDAMAAAHNAVRDFERATDGIVTVSCFVSVGQVLFGTLLTELRRQANAPEVRFVDEDVAQEDFPALTARYDLVLAHRLRHSPPWPSTSLTVMTLAHEPLDIALPAEHRLAKKSSLTPEDVVGERWVTSRGGFSPHDVTSAVAALAGRPAEVVHLINDYGGVAEVVAAGDAIGVLPRYTSGRANDPRIVLRPLPGLRISRSIDILARPESLRRRSVQEVVAALERVMTGLMSDGA
nr:LysR family transcriptional regulator [Streptomyces sp. SID3343]